MKLVTVIPIARGVFKDTLTYFSSKDVSPGSLASITVKNRSINALIVGVENLQSGKASVKSASFSLKKLGNVKPNIFSEGFIKAASRTADYFAVSVGSVIQVFAPKKILDAAPKAPTLKNGNSKEKIKPDLKIEKFAFQADDEDRLAAYRSLIREEFARKSSIFICLPTIGEVTHAALAFGKGIEDYTFVLHSGLTPQKQLSVWNKAVNEEHPVVIVATSMFMSIPRADISTIIIERENSRAYRTIGRPEIDARVFAEYLAEERGAKIIFGGRLLRIETMHRYNERELTSFVSVKFRSLSSAAGGVVDMKPYKEPGKTPKAISKELAFLIEMSVRDRDQLFIMASRKGFAPLTVCSDCGSLVSCGNCGTPLTLKEEKGWRIFFCRACGAERRIEKDGEEHCRICKSWRLAPLGAGLDQVALELKQKFPEVPVFIISGDITKTEKAAKKVIALFEKSEGGILLGTEMAIPYLPEKIDAAAIVGIDSIFSVADYRINERIFSLLLMLRAISVKTVLVQTNNADRPLLHEALRGDLQSFYRRELAEREELSYPPFSTLIKISWDAKKNTAEKEAEEMAVKLKDDARPYITRTGGTKAFVKANILIKLKQGLWPDKNLNNLLRALPPKYTVSVNPDSIL